MENMFIMLGQTGGMPQMVFEYILRKNGIDPAADVNIDQSIDFGSTAAAFSGGQGDFTVVKYMLLHPQIRNVNPHTLRVPASTSICRMISFQ